MNKISEVDQYIAGLDDWRGERIAHFRDMIHQTHPEIREDFKWGVPVFMQHKLVLAMSAFRDHIKINFFYGAQLPDPHKLFNSGLDSKAHRSINMTRDSELNREALLELLRAAIDRDNEEENI